MKMPRTRGQQTAKSVGRFRPPVPQRFPEGIRLLVHAACAAHGGPGRMSLADWHDVEQQIKRRLENEQ
jgi:hypothetical protein